MGCWPKLKKSLVPLALLSVSPFVLADEAKQSIEAEYVQGEVIVKLKDGFTGQVGIFSDLNLELLEEVKAGERPLYHLKTNDKSSIKMIIQRLEENPMVEYAEPNFIYRTHSTDDPRLSDLWGLNNTGSNDPSRRPGVEGADIDAFKAWELERGNREIKVAVIDTGIDYNHPDLKENIWTNEAELNGEEGVDDDGNGFVDDIHGWDFAYGDNDPMDGHSHGTHCAGTIGAVHNNGIGVAGVMAEVSMVAVKFLTDRGSGSTINAIKAIDYASGLDVDIMSNSWGGGGFSQALKESIERASAKGIVFTAAAGNSSTNNDQRPHYPSNYQVPNVVSVASHTAQDTLSNFSCYGRTTVHVAAPGSKILSTVKNGGYSVFSGTSMATPHVSGAIGLLIAKEGRLDHVALRERVMATSTPIQSYRRKTIGGGRLNAYNLLTDTRPERNEPDPSAWERVDLDEAFETEHPYGHRQNVSKTYSFPGAKFVRVVVEKYDLEAGYDFLSVENGSRNTIDRISGEGTEYKTDYVEGDQIVVKFTSDSSVNSWGFLIRAVEVIR